MILATLNPTPVIAPPIKTYNGYEKSIPTLIPAGSTIKFIMNSITDPKENAMNEAINGVLSKSLTEHL